MTHIFNMENATHSIKDLKFSLRKSRGIINKCLHALKSEGMKEASNAAGAAQTESAFLELQRNLRTLSMFVEMEWSADPEMDHLCYVGDICDILNVEEEWCGESRLGVIQTPWETLKEAFKDKILGPAKSGGAYGVYAKAYRSIPLPSVIIACCEF